MAEIREVSSSDWRLWRSLRLAALREAPYAFASTLADWQGDGDTEERWRARLDWAQFNAIAYSETVPVGMVSCRESGDHAELMSMWVVPDARGQGIGDSLVQAVIEWAIDRGVEVLRLGVAEGNVRATQLYRRYGFHDAGESNEFCEKMMTLRIAPPLR